jgi:hypothetical protein
VDWKILRACQATVDNRFHSIHCASSGGKCGSASDPRRDGLGPGRAVETFREPGPSPGSIRVSHQGFLLTDPISAQGDNGPMQRAFVAALRRAGADGYAWLVSDRLRVANRHHRRRGPRSCRRY